MPARIAYFAERKAVSLNRILRPRIVFNQHLASSDLASEVYCLYLAAQSGGAAGMTSNELIGRWGGRSHSNVFAGEEPTWSQK
jgi:hypothetical protein